MTLPEMFSTKQLKAEDDRFCDLYKTHVGIRSGRMFLNQMASRGLCLMDIDNYVALKDLVRFLEKKLANGENA